LFTAHTKSQNWSKAQNILLQPSATRHAVLSPSMVDVAEPAGEKWGQRLNDDDEIDGRSRDIDAMTSTHRAVWIRLPFQTPLSRDYHPLSSAGAFARGQSM